MRLPADRTKLNKQKLLDAFPTDLQHEVEVVVAFLQDQNFDIHPTVQQEIVLNGNKLIIPGRVYSDEPTETTGNTLTSIQQTILNCIYLRHHNGYVRQKRLEKLINNTDYFVIPYVFHLLGEYIVEIIEVVDQHINERTIDNYLTFFQENQRYRQQTESRMISYWDAYYRRTKHKRLNDYIGKQIFNRIKESERRMANLNV